MKNFINIIKGIIIGIATLVPGVSGGTMAIILGIYDDLIHAVSSFFKDIKKNIIFLATIGLGGVIGLATFSKIVEYGLHCFKFPMLYLFLGIIFGGLPVLYKKANIGNKKVSDWFYFIAGMAIIVVMSLYEGTIVNLASSTGILNVIFLVLAGFIIAVALILPGISTSFMLLALGLYDITIGAINNLQFNYLIPIVIGVGIGVITTTKVLENLMHNKPRKTYLVILGFVVGSIVQVFPGLPVGIDLIASPLTFVLGFMVIRLISDKYAE